MELNNIKNLLWYEETEQESPEIKPYYNYKEELAIEYYYNNKYNNNDNNRYKEI